MRSRLNRFVITILLILSLGYFYLGHQLIAPLDVRVSVREMLWIILAFPTAMILWLPLVRWVRDDETDSQWLRWMELGAFYSIGFLSFVLFFTAIRDLVLVPIAWVTDSNFPLYRGSISAAILVSALFSFAMGYAIAHGKPTIKRVSLPIPNLPEDLEGLTIAQISDLHIGVSIKKPFIERIVAVLNSLDADIVALTGDIGDGDPSLLRDAMEPLSRISARLGRFYVTGNHEYYWGADHWIEEATQARFTPLLNSHRIIEKGKSKLLVAGVLDHWVSQVHPGAVSDPKIALEGAPETDVRILLAHQPKTALAASVAGYDLQLSGHTHGGQFVPWTWVIRLFQPFVRGLYRCGKMWVYVNQGTGFWGPPVRLGSSPEISLIQLTRAAS